MRMGWVRATASLAAMLRISLPSTFRTRGGSFRGSSSTAGLRWDPFISQHNKYGMASDFTLAGYQALTFSKQYVNAPPGVTFPGDAGFNGTSNTNNTYNAFAPRVGFVWDLNGKGTQTLRAGYGYFYDTSVLWNTMHVVLNPPWRDALFHTALSRCGGRSCESICRSQRAKPVSHPAKSSVYFHLSGQRDVDL